MENPDKDKTAAASSLTFGFDIGIASVGWAVLGSHRIVDLGVRTFDKAEDKDGQPLNRARREKRSMRTRLARRVLRLKKLRRLLREHGVVEASDVANFTTPPGTDDPWSLRAQGLDRLLSPGEWARVLYHLVKHRGFYAARKSETVDESSDGGKLSQGVKRTSELRAQLEYRTLGEMAGKSELFASAKRNKAGDYSISFSRTELREELQALFSAQRHFDSQHAAPGLLATVDDLFWYQKPALSGEAMLRLVGKCTFEKKEFRAAKRTFSAERFVWLTKLNNLRVIHNGERRRLTAAERAVAIPLPYELSKVTYRQLRKALEKAVGLPSDSGFAGLSYRSDEKKDPEEATFVELKGWHELRKAFERASLGDSWKRISLDHSLLDEIASALTLLKTDNEIRDRLVGLGLSDVEADAVLAVSFTDFLQLSLRALRRLLPLMESGARYDEACAQSGYSHFAPNATHRSRTLPPLAYSDIRNPVVFRALNQARKVLNALIREYGSPQAVHIELARDLSKPLDERQEIKRGQEVFAKEREAAMKLFSETFPGHIANGRNQDLAKFRLYREQDGQCAYSQEALDITRLIEVGYAEIDHVLPYSRSYDDSQNNKVLVLSRENRNKGNRTPFEYLDGANESERWRNFEAWVRGHKGIRKAKRDRLLRRIFDETEARDFSERNLNDTRFATRFFANFVRQHLNFSFDAASDPVLCPSGSFTNFLRARWGLLKNREDGDLHHALDAAVIAGASRTLI
jgi:CRISPR-associated endonuclease Csn1